MESFPYLLLYEIMNEKSLFRMGKEELGQSKKARHGLIDF